MITARQKNVICHNTLETEHKLCKISVWRSASNTNTGQFFPVVRFVLLCDVVWQYFCHNILPGIRACHIPTGQRISPDFRPSSQLHSSSWSQRPSETIRDHQRPSETIRDYQRLSETAAAAVAHLSIYLQTILISWLMLIILTSGCYDCPSSVAWLDSSEKTALKIGVICGGKLEAQLWQG